MRRTISILILLGLIPVSQPWLSAAGPEQTSDRKETTRCCVILQYKQEPRSKGFHLIVKGSQGFYRLYQHGPEAFGLARNEQKDGGQPQVFEMGSFPVAGGLGAWHTIIFEMMDEKIRVIFDGKIVLSIEDPKPLPLAMAELVVLVPGAKPARPEPNDPTAPSYNIIFYQIEAPGIIFAAIGEFGGKA